MAEIEKFDGDMFWDYDDSESMVDDPDEFMEEVGCGTVIRFEQAQRLPNIYGVRIYIAAKDEYVTRYFTDKAEADAVCDGAAETEKRNG
jgi:hypothetical protein